MKINIIDLAFMGTQNAIAAFVVESETGLLLIETGPSSTLPYLQAALKLNGWQMADFQHVFLSHIHFDHAGAAWQFAQNGSKIYVHPKGLPHLAEPERLYNSAKQIYGEKMEALWGTMQSIDKQQLIAPAHGENYLFGNIRCTAWYTPGHAVHHIAWQLEDLSTGESVLFTGDAAGVRIGNGPAMPPCPPPDIHIEHWLESIALMKNLAVDRLFLTHFGVITDIENHFAALENRLSTWRDWMFPYFEKKVEISSVVPDFQAFVYDDLRKHGVADIELKQYDLANPAYMSVAGLMRYWSKRV